MKKYLFYISFLVAGFNCAAMAQSIDDFSFIEGVWTSNVQFQTEKGDWGSPETAQATGQPILGGAMRELDAVVPFPGATFMMRMTFAYDRFNELYRIVVFDDINGYADLYMGRKTEAGAIVADNLETGTAFPDGAGGKVFGRLTIAPNDGGFQIDADTTSGADKAWSPYMRMRFTPRE